ncbi:Sodium-potassium/proton antiporter ChaA [Paraburkholderia domus]|uniref:Sodium-potassium/proton antiporter ChaA n=1 Tax=Paraburkholderia domus TaxID=2793075 RepID=A0A9N8MQG6_9BURK|nr:ionic transporter y4hA [Paraburkholderia domus]MBK5051388.1 ionic transporter y4hA [Burkholderia sp. R-70006]MBK5061694.1 ionic transporter y4hA [Burkholderia sp. R-70199]MBK5090770.1 ionic transporter y4hA [Burkholderia sp. R-69927]MBK5123878.1 ionic transporter y4hA [Burkholderia sp. R-69980]MBK5165504.1 ionic transporter y4hA [Burkholderia sp. R-70211]MBK5185126.1 ionic transporter y4hA [Burkholderia sp. R-69749]MCI0148446.1 ionic transporter y4hA [Paraburkholderia sediminicola]
MTTPATVLPRWTIAAPFVAWIVLGVAYALPGNGLLLALIGVALCAAVFTAVHHAEVVAHRVGEPFGTLVLAVAVTVIEVALIVSVMLTSGPEKAGLARDTVFAAVMIVCNGIVGICLLVGGIRHREQDFQSRGAAASLAVLASLSVLTLVMPNYTTTKVGPVLSSSQLAFAGVSSLVLYGVFVFVQTVRHRDYFLAGVPDEDVHAAPPSTGVALASGGLLVVCLVAVVLLAKVLSPVVETAVKNAGAPPAVVGIIIAALVLLPEGLAAVRAARADRLQNSLNLALGSALASIGLTIPTVAVVFLWTAQPLILGIDGKETVLLMLTLVVGTLTLSGGRTTILQGAVHLSLFAAYLFLSFAP